MNECKKPVSDFNANINASQGPTMQRLRTHTHTSRRGEPALGVSPSPSKRRTELLSQSGDGWKGVSEHFPPHLVPKGLSITHFLCSSPPHFPSLSSPFLHFLGSPSPLGDPSTSDVCPLHRQLLPHPSPVLAALFSPPKPSSPPTPSGPPASRLPFSQEPGLQGLPVSPNLSARRSPRTSSAARLAALPSYPPSRLQTPQDSAAKTDAGVSPSSTSRLPVGGSGPALLPCIWVLDELPSPENYAMFLKGDQGTSCAHTT